MGDRGVDAAFDSLTAARVHTPGLELWNGALEGGKHPPEGPLAPDEVRREHERLVDALESAGVDVRQLADDLAASGELDTFLEEHVIAPGNGNLGTVTEGLGPAEQLGLTLAQPRLDRTEKGATTINVDRTVAMAYCQRASSLVGDRGPVLAAMSDRERGTEVHVARAALAGADVDVVHCADPDEGPIEGGDFLPAGEFALLGVSGLVDGEEVVRRTDVDAARALLAADAVGYPEVALVRSPVETARRRFDGHPRVAPERLLSWCNFAAVDLAVLDADLAHAADVEVYVRDAGDYELDRSTTLLSYLDVKGFDWIRVDAAERWPTSFLPLDDGVVLPTYEPDNDGDYHPELNPTIEALKDHGVTVLPDGEGLPCGALADRAGGVAAMVCPIDRS